MSPQLRWAILVTDWAMIAYWSLTIAILVFALPVPGEWLFKDYHSPILQAWNWSFLPIDAAFSITGLLAVRASRNSKEIWRPLALISLVLTFCAGAMAISFWTLRLEFDWLWYLPNLALAIWPMLFLRELLQPPTAG